MHLAIEIAANLILGIVLLGLFVWARGREPARLASADEALSIFRQRFPEAVGIATVASEGRGALLALRDGVGLLHLHGRRWNARKLLPEELNAVAVTHGNTITLTFADFGWPRSQILIEDTEARSAWLARLNGLAASGRGQAHSVVTHHA